MFVVCFLEYVLQKGLSNANKLPSLNCLFASKKSLNIFQVCRSHLLFALISEETSTTFPLWKLQKSEVTSNTTWPLESSKTQRLYNTIPWSKTVSSQNPPVTVTYSWTSAVFAKFHSKRNISSSLWIWKIASDWFIFGPSFVTILRLSWVVLTAVFSSLLNYKCDCEWRWVLIMTADLTLCAISTTTKYFFTDTDFLHSFTLCSGYTIRPPVSLPYVNCRNWDLFLSYYTTSSDFCFFLKETSKIWKEEVDVDSLPFNPCNLQVDNDSKALFCLSVLLYIMFL